MLPLISGIYRSPDALGLHAALGLMFVSLLFTLGLPAKRWPAGLTAVLLFVGLLLSGRRKMLVLPIFFGLGWLLTKIRTPALRRIVGPAVVAMAVGMAIIAAISEYGPYAEYLKTLAQDTLPRVNKSFTEIRETLRQYGFWGAGLGTATQGARQLVPHDLNIFQEDGLSRALAELGVPGVLLALAAIGLISRAALKAWRLRPNAPLVQGMLLVVLANVASFFVSHQVYSGDVPLLLITSMCLGIALSTAEPSAAETAS